MGIAKPEGSVITTLSAVKTGTGPTTLAPPWSRKQVDWLGKGIGVLRLATHGTSRWFLGGGVSPKTVYPHEKIFERVSIAKSDLLLKTKMNPWPSHLACLEDVKVWKQKLEELVGNSKPHFDHDHVTFWFVPDAKSFDIQSECIVLDGHHSRAAQRMSNSNLLFSWVEAFYNPALQMRPIYRYGRLAAWLEKLKKQKIIEETSEDEARRHIHSFEVVEPHRKWWGVVVNAGQYLSKPDQKPLVAVDVLHRVARSTGGSRHLLKTATSKEELFEELNRQNADALLLFENYPKEYIWSRALAGELFPQKSTYFYPKIPFGLLVQDLVG